MKAILMVLACAVPLSAQSSRADSAKATAIVARHTAAIGGAPALQAIKNVHTVMTATMPGMPGAPEIRSETYAKTPNLVYMKMDMPGIGQMEMGYDGKSAWSISAATGPSIHEEIPQQILDIMKFDGLPFEGMRMTYTGRRQIGGRKLDAVRAVGPDSQVAIHYFDVATGLLAGMEVEGAPPPPADRMTLSFDDYRRFGAVLLATRTTMITQGQEMVMRIVSVSHDPLDAKIFDPPPAVQQLRNKPQ